MGKCWDKLQTHFGTILSENDYYHKMLKFLKNIEINVLLYGVFGFPTDLFIDEIMKNKYNISRITKQECFLNKDIVYLHHPCFLEIDLSHPSCHKNITTIFKFITNTIMNKNIHNDKHMIIIKHIDVLKSLEFNSFRILLEKYSQNAIFLCSTHKLDKIDVPVKSRLTLIRLPLFQHSEIKHIFDIYLDSKLNKYLEKNKTRDIIKSVFLHDISEECDLDEDFVTFKFPPIKDFVVSLKKSKNLQTIRDFSFKCFQYNISISDITCDLLKIVSNDKKAKIIQCSAEIEHCLKMTNRGREPLYIESLLCQVFL